MTSLEQAESLANKLGLEPESEDDDYLETIQKHMEAFARESTRGLSQAHLELIRAHTELKHANRELLKDRERLECAMPTLARAARSLNNLASLGHLNPETKRLIQALADAINLHDRQAIDKAALAKRLTKGGDAHASAFSNDGEVMSRDASALNNANALAKERTE